MKFRLSLPALLATVLFHFLLIAQLVDTPIATPEAQPATPLTAALLASPTITEPVAHNAGAAAPAPHPTPKPREAKAPRVDEPKGAPPPPKPKEAATHSAGERRTPSPAKPPPLVPSHESVPTRPARANARAETPPASPPAAVSSSMPAPASASASNSISDTASASRTESAPRAASNDAPPAASGTAPAESPAPVRTPVSDAKYAATNRKPRYPSLSRAAGEQGTVFLHVLVNIDGAVDDLKLAESSGYPLLDQAAASAVRQWRFHPATIDGKPVAEWYEVPIPFTLVER